MKMRREYPRTEPRPGASKCLGALECVVGKPFQVSTTTVVLPLSKRQRGPEVVRG